jgi:CoA:oxalate CoA-transferase
VIVKAGEYRLVGSPIRVAGYDPDYGAPPRLGEHGDPADTASAT